MTVKQYLRTKDRDGGWWAPFPPGEIVEGFLERDLTGVVYHSQPWGCVAPAEGNWDHSQPWDSSDKNWWFFELAPRKPAPDPDVISYSYILPSGNLATSPEHRDVTRRLVEAGTVNKIELTGDPHRLEKYGQDYMKVTLERGGEPGNEAKWKVEVITGGKFEDDFGEEVKSNRRSWRSLHDAAFMVAGQAVAASCFKNRVRWMTLGRVYDSAWWGWIEAAYSPDPFVRAVEAFSGVFAQSAINDMGGYQGMGGSVAHVHLSDFLNKDPEALRRTLDLLSEDNEKLHAVTMAYVGYDPDKMSKVFERAKEIVFWNWGVITKVAEQLILKQRLGGIAWANKRESRDGDLFEHWGWPTWGEDFPPWETHPRWVTAEQWAYYIGIDSDSDDHDEYSDFVAGLDHVKEAAKRDPEGFLEAYNAAIRYRDICRERLRDR